jgi:hypothetical protein
MGMASEEDVAIPEPDDSDDASGADDEQQEHPTGERQAAINRDVDPPA